MWIVEILSNWQRYGFLGEDDEVVLLAEAIRFPSKAAAADAAAKFLLEELDDCYHVGLWCW